MFHSILVFLHTHTVDIVPKHLGECSGSSYFMYLPMQYSKYLQVGDALSHLILCTHLHLVLVSTSSVSLEHLESSENPIH